MAQAIPPSSTYIKFSYTSAVYKAQLPSHRPKGAPFCSLEYQAASAHTNKALSCPSPQQDSLQLGSPRLEVQTNPEDTCLAENLSKAPGCAHKPVQQLSHLLVSNSFLIPVRFCTESLQNPSCHRKQGCGVSGNAAPKRCDCSLCSNTARKPSSKVTLVRSVIERREREETGAAPVLRQLTTHFPALCGAGR